MVQNKGSQSCVVTANISECWMWCFIYLISFIPCARRPTVTHSTHYAQIALAGWFTLGMTHSVTYNIFVDDMSDTRSNTHTIWGRYKPVTWLQQMGAALVGIGVHPQLCCGLWFSMIINILLYSLRLTCW